VSEGLLPDGSRLHSCLEQLQDIVGPALSRERLVQVVLAADFDVNRALNFIYSSPDPSPSLESDLRRVSD
jgi:HBS1 N-terminus